MNFVIVQGPNGEIKDIAVVTAHQVSESITRHIYSHPVTVTSEDKVTHFSNNEGEVDVTQAKYFTAEDSFCQHCGANIPRREGEGACFECDPKGCLLNWVRIQLAIAADNKGAVDDYCFQRDQGKIDILHELEDMLDDG